ncbi:MAG TPA: 2-oxoglutarate ferredoxin oxidoreductase subunit alpha, partial [Bacteroidia bacterium]|nr:2-oxoglutarate ferredoxin oxidoreductase subunit alpha [Bacteroidia bacterium]
MTPVIFLSDGYIANGAEPWQFPNSSDLAEIKVNFAKASGDGTKFLPYKRDELLSRPWAIPGTKDLEHRIGGLEKQHETGNISYDPANHEFMVRMREAKVDKIADYIPDIVPEVGTNKGKMLVLGWGSTFGAIKSSVLKARAQGYDVSHAHLRYIKPFPKNLGELLYNFEHVLIPELNCGQLIKVIRDKYLIPAKGLNKVQGLPFSAEEIFSKIEETLK